MGVFGDLFGKKDKKLRGLDIVWQKKEIKLKQLLVTAEKAMEEGYWVFISYYFKHSCEEFKQATNSAKYCETTSLGEDGFVLDKKTALISYDLLKDPSKCYRLLSKVKGHNVKILFMEHYPLFNIEKTIEDNLRQIEDKEIRINYFVSLDEPLLAKFAGSNIKELLLKMGMSEDESISHSMIDKAIMNLQEKLNKKTVYEYKADSIESWMKTNLPLDLS